MDTYSKQFLIGFIRGLVDTDGGTYTPKRRVQYGTVSINLANQAKQIFELLNLKYGYYPCPDKRANHLPMHHLHLHGENAFKFLNIVVPRNPKRKI